MKMTLLKRILPLGFLVMASAVEAEEIAVIVNPLAGFNQLTQFEIRQLFMGKSKTLPDKQSVMTLMHPDGSPRRVGFDKVVLERDAKEAQAYWVQMIFTGRGRPPRQLTDDASIKQEVARNRNAIGYINKKSVDSTVKVVFVIDARS